MSSALEQGRDCCLVPPVNRLALPQGNTQHACLSVSVSPIKDHPHHTTRLTLTCFSRKPAAVFTVHKDKSLV